MIGVLQPNLRRRPRYDLVFDDSTQTAAPVVASGVARAVLLVGVDTEHYVARKRLGLRDSRRVQ